VQGRGGRENGNPERGGDVNKGGKRKLGNKKGDVIKLLGKTGNRLVSDSEGKRV